MENLTNEQLATAMAAATIDYSNIYVQLYKTNQINRQLWGALHTGFIAALMFTGAVNEKNVDEITKLAQEKINEVTKGMEQK